MKKLQLWSICLLILAMLTMAVSCSGPSGDGTNTNETVTTSGATKEEVPAESGTNDSQPTNTNEPTNTSEPDNGTTAPEETKADIRPGKDEDHDWEGYQPFP